MPYLPPPRASSTPGTAAHRRFPPLGGSVNSPPACGGALGELMLTWKKRDAWIGVFDILGSGTSSEKPIRISRVQY